MQNPIRPTKPAPPAAAQSNIPEPVPTFQFRLAPTWEQKLDLIGNGAADDVDSANACQTCAANPQASVVTHRALEPIPATEIQPRPKDLRPWLVSANSGGRPITLLSTLMTSACEKDCYYCATRRGRNRARRETFKPEELAKGFDELYRKGIANGIQLSSGVIGGGTRTMEKTIATIEILRRKYEFRDYVHLKLMPGTEPAAIERALQLANRVSVNLEAPSPERLVKMTGTKNFTEELLKPLRVARALMNKQPQLKTSMVTQFIVGASEEADREIVSTMTQLYGELKLSRVYFCAFHPIEETPLENHAATPFVRQTRLYQTDFLFRQYGFTYDDFVFDGDGNLSLQDDPKRLAALKHPERFPLEINTASREELLRVPGFGPKSVLRLMALRQAHTLDALEEVARLGADAPRAAPFILLNGKTATRQLRLFE